MVSFVDSENERSKAQMKNLGLEVSDSFTAKAITGEINPLVEGDVIDFPKDLKGKVMTTATAAQIAYHKEHSNSSLPQYVNCKVTNNGAESVKAVYPSSFLKFGVIVDDEGQRVNKIMRASGEVAKLMKTYPDMAAATQALLGKKIIVSKMETGKIHVFGQPDNVVRDTHFGTYDFVK